VLFEQIGGGCRDTAFSYRAGRPIQQKLLYDADAMFEEGAFPKPIPENPHAVTNNLGGIMDPIGKFAHWEREKLRPPGRLEKYRKGLDPRTQLHVTGEGSLRTAYPDRSRNVVIPMPDARQDS